MHYVGIPLDDHKLGDADRAVLTYAPQVVAPQVDQHHMLGALFRVREQLGLQPLILLWIDPAPPRPRDRVQLRHSVLQSHQHLGRGSDQLGRSKIDKEHVGRGI